MINNIGLNTRSFGVQRTSGQSNAGQSQEVTPNPTDGFQSSGLAAPSEANAQKEVVLTVTPSQMATQDFQATLASLAAAGTPVQVVMVAEGALAPKTDPTPKPQPQAQPQPQPPARPYTPPPPAPHRTPSFGSD